MTTLGRDIEAVLELEEREALTYKPFAWKPGEDVIVICDRDGTSLNVADILIVTTRHHAFLSYGERVAATCGRQGSSAPHIDIVRADRSLTAISAQDVRVDRAPNAASAFLLAQYEGDVVKARQSIVEWESRHGVALERIEELHAIIASTETGVCSRCGQTLPVQS